MRIVPRGPHGSWAGSVSWRAVVVLVVVVLSAATVIPTVRGYLHQQGELEQLRAERDAVRAEVSDLEAEVARWDDPYYIQAQARERLAFVFPGEVPFRVLDPDVVSAVVEGSLAAEHASTGANATPWYDQLSESLIQVGAPEPPVTEQPEDDRDTPELLTDIDFGG